MTNPILHPLAESKRLSLVVSGATGFIGSAATDVLEQRGHLVRRLVRRASKSENEISWDPERETIDAARLEGTDVVINLAGENLAQRWSDGVKERIRDSRVKGTTTLSRAIAS